MERHNPGVFDFFLSFPSPGLTERMREIMRHYGVTFIPSEALSKETGLSSLPTMAEGNWPEEIFLNWVFPDKLAELGYDYSVKVDYDVLCIAPYEGIDGLLPKEGVVSALTFKAELGIPERAGALVKKDTGFDCFKGVSLNVGFVIFNNSEFVKSEYSHRFFSVYRSLYRHCPNVKLLEQVAAAVLTFNIPYKVTDLGYRYNQRVMWATQNEGLSVDVYNVHYVSTEKPWKPIRLNVVDQMAKNGKGILPFYRNLWLEFARTVEGFDEFCQERPMTSMEILALAMRVLKATSS